ncbi:hypothetical protein predicted by Glimmer/Critica [Acetobacter ghanensis]|uniref:Uncharacterized protein n=1 Tax=Acetobacter ghanensis TaxID=431306 RepID=A0A0U5BHV6_9PROT|nr:hypothetical protein predicted by Glimmer/Critica [Acetobacter ghanensis]
MQQHLTRMAGQTGIRSHKPPLPVAAYKAHALKTLKARIVLHAAGAAAGACKVNPVQGGAATRLQIRLVPHSAQDHRSRTELQDLHITRCQ